MPLGDDEDLSRTHLAAAQDAIAAGKYDYAALEIGMAQVHATLEVSKAIWEVPR